MLPRDPQPLALRPASWCLTRREIPLLAELPAHTHWRPLSCNPVPLGYRCPSGTKSTLRDGEGPDQETVARFVRDPPSFFAHPWKRTGARCEDERSGYAREVGPLEPRKRLGSWGVRAPYDSPFPDSDPPLSSHHPLDRLVKSVTKVYSRFPKPGPAVCHPSPSSATGTGSRAASHG